MGSATFISHKIIDGPQTSNVCETSATDNRQTLDVCGTRLQDVKLALREGHDVINSVFTGAIGQYNQLKLRSSEYNGVSSDPVLEVTYIVPTTISTPTLTLTPEPISTPAPAPTVITYAYDSAGQRIKVANATTTYYPTKFYNIHSASSLPAGNTITKHVFAGGQNLATIEGSGASTAVYYNHSDLLQSSNVMTDSAGAIAETMDYFPFGGIRIDQKATSSTFNEQRKYIGQEYDVDTNLNYLNARYYNAILARFISQDPVFLAIGDNDQLKRLTGQELQQYLSDPQALNSYSYANNNPVVRSDPNGQFSMPNPTESLRVALIGMQQWLGSYLTQARQNFNAFEFQAKSTEAMKNGSIYLGTNNSGQDLQFGVLGVVGSIKPSITPQQVEKIIQGIGAEVRNTLLRYMDDKKLGNIIKSLFKDSDTLPGGTIGAIEHTVNTGQLIKNSDHIEKGINSLSSLNKFLEKSNVTSNAQVIAQTLYNKVSGALSKAFK